MKTLEAFWRWVDNEKPETLTVVQKACSSKALSPLARTAIDQGADVVWAMHKDSPVGFSLKSALDNHRDDLRDVSFALLPALEKVVERRTAAGMAHRAVLKAAVEKCLPNSGGAVIYTTTITRLV